VEWGTAAVLVALVTLEGVRRVPPGALVLRRSLVGTWEVAARGGDRPAWRFVSWYPPLWTTLLLPPATGTARSHRSGPERLAAGGPWIAALRASGALTLLGLVAIPVAAVRLTAAGVVLVMAAVLLAAIATAGLGWWARRRLGLARRPAFAALSPFAAPYAAERLLEELTAGLTPLAVARALLPAARFETWIRPRVYDAAAGATDAELDGVLARSARAAVLAAPARPADAAVYCPRCGAVYQHAPACADCDGVATRAFDAGPAEA
jgi:hypothetical protein